MSNTQIAQTDGSPSGSLTEETEFKELCALVRHYSGLRYVVIPAFLAIHGAIFLALKDGILAKVNVSGFSAHLLQAVPLVLGAIFLVFEYTLNKCLDSLVAVAKGQWPESFWALASRTKYVVTV